MGGRKQWTPCGRQSGGLPRDPPSSPSISTRKLFPEPCARREWLPPEPPWTPLSSAHPQPHSRLPSPGIWGCPSCSCFLASVHFSHQLCLCVSYCRVAKIHGPHHLRELQLQFVASFGEETLKFSKTVLYLCVWRMKGRRGWCVLKRFCNPGKVTSACRHPQPIPVGLSGGVSIFFLFTCPHLVVSQSGFSREITHFFKESSHTIMKVSPQTNKHFGKSPKKKQIQCQCSRPAGLREELMLEFKSEGWVLAEFLPFGGKSVFVQAFN